MNISDIGNSTFLIPSQECALELVWNFQHWLPVDSTPAQIQDAMRVHLTTLLGKDWIFNTNANYSISLAPASLWIDTSNCNLSFPFSPTDFSGRELNLVPNIHWEVDSHLVLSNNSQIQVQYTSIWVVATLLSWKNSIDISANL